MKSEFKEALEVIASHPATYGISAALARWTLGDRRGGWWAFLGYVIASLFIAWVAYVYLVDEDLTSGRKTFYILLVSFAARDILAASLVILRELSNDPLGTVSKLRAAFSRGNK